MGAISAGIDVWASFSLGNASISLGKWAQLSIPAYIAAARAAFIRRRGDPKSDLPSADCLRQPSGSFWARWSLLWMSSPSPQPNWLRWKSSTAGLRGLRPFPSTHIRHSARRIARAILGSQSFEAMLCFAKSPSASLDEGFAPGREYGRAQLERAPSLGLRSSDLVRSHTLRCALPYSGGVPPPLTPLLSSSLRRTWVINKLITHVLLSLSSSRGVRGAARPPSAFQARIASDSMVNKRSLSLESWLFESISAWNLFPGRYSIMMPKNEAQSAVFHSNSIVNSVQTSDTCILIPPFLDPTNWWKMMIYQLQAYRYHQF